MQFIIKIGHNFLELSASYEPGSLSFEVYDGAHYILSDYIPDDIGCVEIVPGANGEADLVFYVHSFDVARPQFAMRSRYQGVTAQIDTRHVEEKRKQLHADDIHHVYVSLPAL